MKLYADEGVDWPIVEALRASGFDVSYAAETVPATTDDAVLRTSATEERLLLASDKDFGELVFRLRKATAGVLLIRLAGLSAALKARLVVDVLNSRSADLKGSFSVLSPGLLRIRRPPSTQ